MMNQIKKQAKKFLLRIGMLNLYFEARNLYKNTTLNKRINNLEKDGFLKPPYEFVLETNFNCNLRCSFCYQREIRTKNHFQISADDVRKTFLFFVRGEISSVMVMGGEVFVRKDIFEIFDVLEELNIPFSITTNGTLINQEKARKLIKYKYLKGVTFSLHGYSKEHDQIVGVPGAFGKAHKAILLLSKKINLTISTVITKNNYRSIRKLIYATRKLEINEIMIATEFSLGEYTDSKATNKKATKLIKNRLVNQIKKLSQYAKKNKIVLTFPTNLMRKEDTLSLFINKKVLEDKNKLKLFCSELLAVRIDPNGNLVYCFLARKIFGNIKKSNLKKLINSKAIRKVRKKITLGNFIPLCEGCCKLEGSFY